MIHQGIGYSRDFPFDIPRIRLEPDLELANLAGIARFTRTPQGLFGQIKMHATIQGECSRCLTPCPQPLDIDFAELYAFSQRSVTQSELVLPEDGKIDLAPLVREYMLLEVPLTTLCKSDCKGLCPTCGVNRNEKECDHGAEDSDPRLSVLKSLLDKK